MNKDLRYMNTAILKVTSHCNLNCSYCYMFNGIDSSFQSRTREMSRNTCQSVIDRIEEWSRATGEHKFHLVLHGGEPTLWNIESIEWFLAAAKAARGVTIELGLQSNGVHITDRMLTALFDYNVSLGISIDGPQEYNDTDRVNHAGRGSYETIMHTVSRIMRSDAASIFGGFLSVANPLIPPQAMWSWITELPRTSVDLIMPMQFNYDNPPWTHFGQTANDYARHPAYGIWLGQMFDLWFEHGDPNIMIRLFDGIIRNLIQPGAQHSDSLVNDRLTSFVINTDGGYEYHDFVRNAFDGSCDTNLDVRNHSFSDLAQTTAMAGYLSLGELAPDECGTCPFLEVCGGGFVPGRLSAIERTPMPAGRSVLCFDEYSLISHIANKIAPTARITVPDVPHEWSVHA